MIKNNTILGMDLFSGEFESSLIFHIPHSKTEIPQQFKSDFVNTELMENEIKLLTDFATDEIFDVGNASKIVFPYSRVFCDVERLEDENEVMFDYGRGFYYTKTDRGELLRQNSNGNKEIIYSDYYLKHHETLTQIVDQKLKENSFALIVDCHSFANTPFKSDMQQGIERPDFCLGTDDYHTPKWLVDMVRLHLTNLDYTVEINYPYKGTIVPLKHYQTNDSVYSIMIEINRNLYMDNKDVLDHKVKELNQLLSHLFCFTKQSDYGKVILPLTVLRRLDCVLKDTKADVLKKHTQVKSMNIQNLDPILNKVAGYNFHNSSLFDFDKLVADPNNIASNLRNYINGFSEEAREIIEQFDFDNQITKLDESNLLFLVLKRFQEIDLNPARVSSMEMGYMFEELIRKFAEISNETAGEHFTPREVIRLMVNLLFMNDREILTQKGIVKTIFDCCAGTGGMLSVAEEYLNEMNPDARLEVFGQEINPESYAICKSDMLIKGQKPDNIAKGNSLLNKDGIKLKGDQFINQKFDYLITNPPFGVKWGKVAKQVTEEHESLGHGGRYGAGLPSKSDGSFLFLMNLMSKMKPKDKGGSRLAIVFNGSPLF